MRQDGRSRWVAALGAGLVALSIVAAGCGESTPEDPTPVKTWKITPAPGGQSTATPAESPAATPGTETAATEPAGTPEVTPGTEAAETPTVTPGTEPPGGEATRLELIGLNTLFDKDELEAPAGTITIVFDNQDPGIVHNVSVFEGEEAEGDPIGLTELEVGPLVQELTLELDAGTYFYQCDAHPATMAGILTVT